MPKPGRKQDEDVADFGFREVPAGEKSRLVRGRIVTVRLDGPERHNVLDVDGWRTLTTAMEVLLAPGR